MSNRAFGARKSQIVRYLLGCKGISSQYTREHLVENVNRGQARQRKTQHKG